jgi:hypothetical protein
VYARRMGMARLHHRAWPRADRGERPKAFASALLQDAPDAEGYGADHALAVAAVSRPVGMELGLDEDALEDLESGALLHDLGKVGVPKAILRKAAPLTREEAGIIKAHPQRGAHGRAVAVPRRGRTGDQASPRALRMGAATPRDSRGSRYRCLRA